MKKLFVKICICMSMLAIAPLQAQDYFEGVVKYSVSYSPLHPDLSEEVLEREVGTRITALVKEDRYSMINNAKGKKGWRKVTVRLDEGYKYTEFQKSDTIYKEKLGTEAHTLLEFTRNKDPKKEILGKECESITIHYQIEDATNGLLEYKGTYYFHPDYRLNPEFYKQDTDGFWNKYVAASGALSLENHVTIPGFMEASQKVTAIEPKTIPDALFEPAVMKIIIEK
ncbi:hypothetical protein SAMN05216480_10355 [Pustulibacterium marinum]|uniref:DUF4412 domain-containing protein n=1 Tax=Pustulibacterium marinum TaxID=1224947 RepID=A0A1I7G1B5_9FLAO|nr:hypothetical protein [Pustulibacterium marinum]SFU42235.1 hypothetical protein SAMN05216480_10355 [Pustulibacterium marinum]